MGEGDAGRRSTSERRADDVFNRRLDQTSSGLHTLALAVIVGGVLRYALDTTASTTLLRVFATLAVGFAIEGLSLYIIRWRKPED